MVVACEVTLPCSDVMVPACEATVLFSDVIAAAWLFSVFCRALTALARLLSVGVEAEAAAGVSKQHTQNDENENDELAHESPFDW